MIEDSRKNNLQSKEGHRGYRQQEALRSLQPDYKAKLHRFWHLLIQIAWPLSFSNFLVLPTATSSWMHWISLSRREPAQYWPRGLVGKCLGCCRLLMHGGTQTIRFWGLQHVHWGCEGSCCCFLRLQSRLVWQVAIQAVDWFVPEHHLSIFCEEWARAVLT